MKYKSKCLRHLNPTIPSMSEYDMEKKKREGKFPKDNFRMVASHEKLYPLGDYHPKASHRPFTSIGMYVKNVMAVNSGIKRCPKKGEWYLSGAIVTAYRAPNDLSSEYYIAEIVEVKEVTLYKAKAIENG
jgi:hypothetical protein